MNWMKMLLAMVLAAGMCSEAGILVRDEFDVAASADPANGIYAHDRGVNATAPVGGNVAGFDASQPWSATSTNLRTHDNDLLCLVGYASSFIGTRKITAGTMNGITTACGRVQLNLAFPEGYGKGYSKIGFTTETASSGIGATIRVLWDGSEWDLEAIYNNGSIAVRKVMNGIRLNTDYTVIWEMDEVADTLKVWVNAESANDAPTATFTDYIGSVQGIDDLYVQYANFDNVAGAKVSPRDGLRYRSVMLADSLETLFLPDPASGFMFVLAEPSDTDLYVAPSARGNGDGLSAESAAAYTDGGFWSRVQNTLDSDAVTVTFLDGEYPGTLTLNSIGNPDYALTLSGESPSGVIFNGSNSDLVTLSWCRNVIVENLNFTGNGTGYALRITMYSHNITVRNCDWYDMPNLYYGATGAHYGSHRITYDNCTFKRLGQDYHFHMMYHSYNADHVSALNCHFEDGAGSYVRFRDGSDYGTVSNCTFVSTQTYPNRSTTIDVFVEFPIFNDVDPGDETASLFGTVVDNTFTFNSAAPSFRIGIRYYLKGYDPEGWSYLMTAEEAAILKSTDSAAKKTLLLNECGIDFDKITIRGNTWNNETIKFQFISEAAYGAQGTTVVADISDIVY